MTIRPHRDTDIATLSRIYLDARRETFMWVAPDLFALADFERDTEGEEIYVAETAGQVTGFVSLWVPEPFIHHLYVDENHRGRGIGSALLTHAVRRLPFPIRLKTPKRNTRAIDFYLRAGWSKTAEGDDGVAGPFWMMTLVKPATPGRC